MTLTACSGADLEVGDGGLLALDQGGVLALEEHPGDVAGRLAHATARSPGRGRGCAGGRTAPNGLATLLAIEDAEISGSETRT